MPKLTAQQEASKQYEDKVLKRLVIGPLTLRNLGCTRYTVLKLLEQKLVKRGAEAKNPGSTARKAVTYELTAKGKKRAEKCSA